ncbi:hypothetical protein GP486_005347 [Trichoglossum hirsutum]|uniref:BTB domain-containing protein n=1 Tax=Trichoglossum hirsutum TaxID=265104 RepID=A0A9P8L9F3_9PEZI|nr:hypothetical protein GP486_005347 [Trichoglossum hirsutum]
MDALHNEDMLKANKQLLQSSKYSDLTIICGNREFNVHRSIVCPRSRFFAAACDGEFLEGKTGKITLMGDDMETVKRMISYLYTLDYEDEEHVDEKVTDDPSVEDEAVEATIEKPRKRSRLSEESRPALFSSVRVYAIAEKYDIPALKTLAKERFSKWARNNWSHKEFPILVKEVFESTPDTDRGLRDIASQLCATHIKSFLQEDGVLDVIEDLGDLWLRVLRQVLKDKEDEMEQVLKRKAEEMQSALEEGEKTMAEIEVCRREDAEREKEIQAALQEELAELKSTIKTLKTENHYSSERQKTLELELDGKNEEVEKKVKKINSLDRCRHCRESFNTQLEDFKYSSITVRCRKCRTRH